MRGHRAYTTTAVAVLGAAALLGCGGQDRGKAGDTGMVADTGMGAAPPAPPATTTESAPGRVAGAAGGAMTDAQIVTAASTSNEMEIASSERALKKATNADVRRFAQQMITDHRKLQREIDEVTKRQNLQPATPPDSMSPDIQRMRQTLDNAPKGRAFDSTYMAMQVQAHQATLGELKQAESSAQNAQLKSTVQKAVPVVERHLARAQEVQSRLSGRSSDTGRRGDSAAAGAMPER